MTERNDSGIRVSPVLWLILAAAGVLATAVGLYLVVMTLRAPSPLDDLRSLVMGVFGTAIGLFLTVTNLRRALRARRRDRAPEDEGSR
jgi:TRAP-type C4-dicarboxylate transport system permease small subunit